MIFSEKIVDEILFYTKEKLLTESPDVFHNAKDVEEAIEALAELMLIEDGEILFNADTLKKFENEFFSRKCLDVINPEAFFKKLLRLDNMNKWEQRPKNEWMMGRLFGHFRLYDRYDSTKQNHLNANGEFVLSECEPEDFAGEGELRVEYCGIRWMRNEPEHGFWTYKGRIIEPEVLPVVIKTILCVLLDMCGKYKGKIHRKYVAQMAARQFSVKNYAQKLVEEYKERESKYLRVLWGPINTGADTTPLDIVTLVARENASRVIKLVGCAGVGKTESMKYAAYFRAKKILADEQNKGKLPIYIPLIQIQERDITIMQLIQETLDLSPEETACVLEAKKCIFFFDGYNEILDVERRKKTAAEIREMIKNYETAQFVIGDRSMNTNPPCATEAICYQLEPLGESQIKGFFKRNVCIEDSNVEDTKTLEIILANYDEKFKWLENASVTPYMLKVLIEMMQGKTEIPQAETTFFTKELEFKMKREYEKKLEHRIPALKECLKDLSQQLLFGTYVDISVIQHCFRESGIGLEVALGYVELCTGMDILEENDDGMIGWRRAEYFSHFFYEYQKRFK